MQAKYKLLAKREGFISFRQYFSIANLVCFGYIDKKLIYVTLSLNLYKVFAMTSTLFYLNHIHL